MLTDEQKLVEGENRAFNMYYPKTEGVQFNTELFTDSHYKRWGHLVGKTGIVLKAEWGVHVFAKGYVYMHTIDFDGEVVEGVTASYLTYCQEILNMMDMFCNKTGN